MQYMWILLVIAGIFGPSATALFIGVVQIVLFFKVFKSIASMFFVR